MPTPAQTHRVLPVVAERYRQTGAAVPAESAVEATHGPTDIESNGTS